MIGKLFSRLSRQAIGDPQVASSTKSWSAAQEYELDHAFGFMSEPFFTDLFSRYKAGELSSAKGYFNELFVREFLQMTSASFGTSSTRSKARHAWTLAPVCSRPW